MLTSLFLTPCGPNTDAFMWFLDTETQVIRKTEIVVVTVHRLDPVVLVLVDKVYRGSSPKLVGISPFEVNLGIVIPSRTLEDQPKVLFREVTTTELKSWPISGFRFFKVHLEKSLRSRRSPIIHTDFSGYVHLMPFQVSQKGVGARQLTTGV